MNYTFWKKKKPISGLKIVKFDGGVERPLVPEIVQIIDQNKLNPTAIDNGLAFCNNCDPDHEHPKFRHQFMDLENERSCFNQEHDIEPMPPMIEDQKGVDKWARTVEYQAYLDLRMEF